MKWWEINLFYELKTPVHIGYLPSKASVISPTRYYIPGKNFWGAYTKALTEACCGTPSPRDYYDVGKWFENNVRFTYFYIYDEDYNDQPLLTPKYSNEGLKYGTLSLSEFQNKFIGSFISTAIDREKGTAEDESLHEIEFINPKYPSNSGTRNTRIFGKMFVKKKFSTEEIKDLDHRRHIEVNKNGIRVDGKDPFRTIFVGGELNCGFGRIEKLNKNPDDDLLDLEFDLKDEKVCINSSDKTPILGHVKYSEKYQFRGDVELVSGRGYKAEKKNKDKRTHRNPGAETAAPEPYFTPGTVIYNHQKVEIDYRGIWNPV